MSYKKVLNALVFLVSILFVNILTTFIGDYALNYLHRMHPAKATAIGMAATVFILFPAFTYIDKWSERTTKKLFNAGKNAAGKFIGLLLVFAITLSVLFTVYLKMWFNVWVWQLKYP